MKRLTRLLFAFVLLALSATPAFATHTKVDSLPEVAVASTLRYDFALTFLGEAIGYGKGEAESANRIHITLKTVPFDGSPAETLEAILYDGVYYTRENDSTQWYIEGEVAAPIPADDMPADSNVTLSYIGEADVAGVSTGHYQFWSSGDGAVSTMDLFIGNVTTPFIHKLQVTAYAEEGGAIASVAGFDYRYYDFNQDIKVYAPTGAIARPAGTSAGTASALLKQGVFQLHEAMVWSK